MVSEQQGDHPTPGPAPALVIAGVIAAILVVIYLVLPFSKPIGPKRAPLECPAVVAWLLNPAIGHSHSPGADAFPETCRPNAVGRLLLADAVAALSWVSAAAVGRPRVERLSRAHVRTLRIGITSLAILLTITTLALGIAVARAAYSDATQRASILLTGVMGLVALASWALVRSVIRSTSGRPEAARSS